MAYVSSRLNQKSHLKTAYGGNRPSFEEPYDLREYSNMFDRNPETFWHGEMEPTQTNRVLINFTHKIIFHRLVIQTRPDQIYDPSRYRNICLFVDGQLDECWNKNVSVGSEIVFEGNSTNSDVSSFEIRFPPGKAAVVAELSIHYEIPTGIFWSAKLEMKYN